MACGLYDQAMLNAKMLVQFEQQFLWGIGRRVAALLRERKPCTRPEYVNMRVASPSRQPSFRLGRRCHPIWSVGGSIGSMCHYTAGSRVRSKAGSCAENCFNHSTRRG